jgi:hypothetical protein
LFARADSIQHDEQLNKLFPSIIAIDLADSVDKGDKLLKLILSNTREEAVEAHDHSRIPYVFKVEATGTDAEARYYELAGASQVHLYKLPSEQKTWGRKISQRFFRESNWLPSSCIMDRLNTAWHMHADSYVRYGDSWYVMDDMTRWKAAATHRTDQGSAAIDKRDAVGKMLLRAYPGAPNMLVYSQIDKELYERLAYNQDTSHAHALELQRDTPITWPLKIKVAAGLIAGAVLDTLLVRTSVVGWARLLGATDEDARKIGNLVGGMIGGAGMWYHAQHLAPLLHTKKQYEPNTPGLGPREPII